MLIKGRKKMRILSSVVLLILGIMIFYPAAEAADVSVTAEAPSVSLIAYEIPIDEITGESGTEAEGPRMGAETSDAAGTDTAVLLLMCAISGMAAVTQVCKSGHRRRASAKEKERG